MKLGSAHPVRFLGVLALTVALSVLAPPHIAAQTDPEQCALDSLVLISPEESGLQVRLSRPGLRFGSYLQWAELNDADATCAAIVGAENLPFGVEVSGSYRDDVDRLIEFFTLDGGEVGTRAKNRLLFRWTNFYVGRSGRLQGEFNISNSGGLLRYDPDAGSWQQLNQGLPQYLAYTNILALAQSAQQPDHLLLHLGGGSPPPGSDPRGLWEKRPGLPWQRVATDVFPSRTVRITKLVFSPTDDNVFVVGTSRKGFYVTRDGGATFRQFSGDLAPNPPEFFEVTAMHWASNGRLYVAIRAYGLFVSTDNGNSFSKLPNLHVPFSDTQPDSLVFPFVNAITEDPGNSSRLLVAIRRLAVYHSTDNGNNWQALTGDWIGPDRKAEGRAVAVSPANGQIVMVGTLNGGLWRTQNGGANWQQVGTDVVPGSTWTGRPVVGVLFDPVQPDRAFAQVDGFGLLRSVDGGASWALDGNQPSNRQALSIATAADGSGDVLLPTYGGGIYVAGTPVEISRTINLGTSDPLYHNLDLGLSISFSEGLIDSGTIFRMKCQDFQGYAVWRSDSTDPFDMALIGLYDKTNPETCIEGFCGDENFILTPNCFSEKRAACFDFSKPDSVVFFDNNVYNGFTYYYAVSTFDYGNTAGVEPAALTNDLLFSSRWPSAYSRSVDPDLIDADSPYPGDGNMVAFEVNVAATGPLDGPEIYVFPNPLRRDVGFPGKEGDRVVWTNLPPDSRVQIFTADGDLVADLGPDRQKGSNMPWITRADDGMGELLASGIYIWKVEMPQRGDFWGKLVIIR